jgi:pheromone a factor receptor
MMFLWWAMPASSIIFFVFFGFGEEARKEYRKLWTWFKRTILRRKDEKSSKLAVSIPSRYVFFLDDVTFLF